MNKWVKEGIIWATIMFLLMIVVIPSIEGEKITLRSVVIGFLAWGIGGVIYGFTLSKIKQKTKLYLMQFQK